MRSKSYYTIRSIVRGAVLLVEAALIILGLWVVYVGVWALQFPY